MLFFLILALIPIAIIGIFSINNTEKLVINLVLRQLQNVATDKAAILERWLGERKADMQVITGTSILKTMNPGMIAAYLTLIENHYGVYKDITVIAANGDIIFKNHGTQPTFDIPKWNDHPAGEQLLLSNIMHLPEEKESTFIIAAPVFDHDTLLGTVYGRVGTNKIITFILSVALGKTGECYLVDKNGTFLAHKEPDRILKENISQSESFKNIFGIRDLKQTYLDYRGIEVFGTFQQVGGTDWYLVVEQDRDEAFESVDALKRYIYLTILIFISSAFLLTWIISSHIVKPIQALSQSADILAGTQFNEGIIKSDRQDEIGILFRAFENMAREVRKRQSNLEQEVNLKEAELKETDLILRQIKLVAERSEKFAAIGRLGAAVAHEIRTPLTSIKLFLESVEGEIEISPEYEEDFTIAMGQIKRIEAAINRFLDYTKPQELIFSEIDIAQLIEDVVFMVKPMANKQECHLDVKIEDHLPKIDGDKKFLEEAMVNLFINSLEAMPNNGQIFVIAARDRFDRTGQVMPCIRIDIKDTGHGISDEHMKLIFEPFFTTKTSGTGLGLPLVINTIKRHGGDVRVESHEGSGTVFSLFLPVKISQN
ncbi:MAG: Cache 3/Cache 2 fusion domain-containing protein [Deltaproteobacteria bacterium]|nr:Cache 3/Cache 2 fusion domain-containing protein [Deltaproteobacteria bacterium]